MKYTDLLWLHSEIGFDSYIHTMNLSFYSISLENVLLSECN